ncbi:hypothetical protein SADUNF_Sadunf02G0016000 [Salix dunnii]|uniref:Uncharacterized protein n=1 Tax=Salix dunnii TaxID=1413687 RepID=A0A835N5S5_9ROSI|nr:hypothetical protein SADUNF_Sadunf02G0016000 [Salix dunnii]
MLTYGSIFTTCSMFDSSGMVDIFFRRIHPDNSVPDSDEERNWQSIAAFLTLNFLCIRWFKIYISETRLYKQAIISVLRWADNHLVHVLSPDMF